MPKNSPKKVARRKRDDVKNINAPRGKHWCWMHNDGEGAYLPKDQFHKNKNRIHGLNDRCKDCAKEYRLKYEEKHGKRSQNTKTFRVTPRTHALAGELARAKGTNYPGIIRRALKFYLDWACANPECDNPRNIKIGPICSTCYAVGYFETKEAIEKGRAA